VLRRTVVLAGPGLALAALVAPVVVLGERLPDPLATHWDLGGTPDGRTAAAAFTAGLVVAVAAAWAVLGAQAARRSERRHRLTAAPLAWGLAGVALAIQAVTVAVNLDAPRWEQAGAVGLWIVPLVLAAGAGPAWLAHRLERGLPVADGAGGRPPERASVGLAPGERAVWTAHTASPYGAAAAAAAAVVLPAAGFAAGGPQGWILVGAGLVLAVAIGTVSELTATVDARGLTLAHGPFARPRWTVPLAEVAAAEPADIDPWRVGGWGVRKVPGRRGATAVVVRGGPGLRVVRTDGRELLVTVPDAEAAAGLLADLAGRAAPQPGSTSRPPAKSWASRT
jgi:hypothetical protein